jgi:hypothetical protein
MATFQSRIHSHYDERIKILARIKTRSLGADSLVLVALTVLAYAQLEGGVKDLSSLVIRDLNSRKLRIGDIAPRLLEWRNSSELQRIRSSINFEMIAEQSPFGATLARRIRLRGISRPQELNQMTWSSLRQIYRGFGLSCSSIAPSAAQMDALVSARNNAAHHGIPPDTASQLLERQLRSYVGVVENVLTDFSLQLLPYFSSKMHLR